ncbi:APC family permease [Dactylosporangium sp. CA-233914]|uniref:APC family permease n=1 Tax=Dactylosporangium sp. CA-233914 TaxID=3239934 RepID=UPI003D904225
MSATTDPQVGASSQGDKAALLHRGLGVGSIVFMVVAAVAPLGAACAVIPLVFALGGNPTAPLYFIGAAIVLYVFAVGFTLMSRHVKNAGAFYSYVQAGLGKVSGAGTASLALISYTILLIALYAYLGVAASAALDRYLDVTVKWWVCSFAFLVIISFLGYRDIEVSAKVLGVALVLEGLVVLVVDFAIIFTGGDSGLSAAPLNPSRLFDGAPGLGLMFAFFAFVGFEATAVFRSEAKEPKRTIPRATYIAVAIIGGLYALTSWAVANGLGVDRAAAVAGGDPSNVMQGLANRYAGSLIEDAVVILLVTSLFACSLSFHNVVARYQFNLANGRVLPAFIGEVHRKHRAPSRSSIVVTIASAGVLGALTIAGLDPVLEIYTWLSGAATLGIVVLMLLTSAAVVAFHWRGRGRDPVWNSVVAPILSFAALSFVVWMMLDNLDLLVGSRAAANWVCAGLVASFVAGAAMTAIAMATSPEKYAQILEN